MPPGLFEQGGVGLRTLDARQRRAGVDHVAVDGFAPEHECRRRERPRAGDPGVDDGVRPPLLERPRGLERRLDGPDPATEGVEPVEERKLSVSGRDDKH